MEVKEIPIANIKVQNRAREDMGDIEELAQNIAEKGLIQPITVDQNMRLLAGERRLLAHKHLGKQTIHAVVRKSDNLDAFEIELAENFYRKNMTWPETCALQKRIFEEKSKKGKWSQTKQAEMLKMSQPHVSRQIQMAEALELLRELAAKTDFAEAWRELQSLGEGLEETPPKAAKQPQQLVKPSSVAVPQWAESSYQVGDVLTVLPGIKDATYDFVELDPPFTDADEYGALYDFIARETYRCLRPDSFAVFWYGWEWHSEVRFILQTAGFVVDAAPAIWVKGNTTLSANNATSQPSQHEPFWIARKGNPVLQNPHGNIFTTPTAGHNSERPIALLDEILRVCCKPQSNILVPFAGSGVTIRAAHKLQHNVVGFDISEVCREKFLKTVERSEDA